MGMLGTRQSSCEIELSAERALLAEVLPLGITQYTHMHKHTHSKAYGQWGGRGVVDELSGRTIPTRVYRVLIF